METKPLTQYERIKAIADLCGISVKQMSEETGRNPNTFYAARKRSDRTINDQTIISLLRWAYSTRGIIINYEWLKTGYGEMTLQKIDPNMKFAAVLKSTTPPIKNPPIKKLTSMVQSLNISMEVCVNLPKRNEHYTAEDIAEILQEYINDYRTASFHVISTEVKQSETIEP